MSRTRNTHRSCQYCQSREAETWDGFCGSCLRKGTVTLSRRERGYQCSLCTLAGQQTSLDDGEHSQHLRDAHGIDDPHDRLAKIREYERVLELSESGTTQGRLDRFS